jgi:ribonuclease P/MRP protein subunit RPP1
VPKIKCMVRSFIDLHICLNVENFNQDLASVINYSELLNLSKIAICLIVENESDLNKVKLLKNEIDLFKTNIKLLTCAKIKTESTETLKLLIMKSRKITDLIMVCGGNLDINRAALEDIRVDILSKPEENRKDSGLDEVMVKLATKNNVFIEFNMGSIINTYGKIRSHILSHQMKNWKMVEHFSAPFIITSGAIDKWGLRTGRELAALGTLIGMELSIALDAVSTNPKKVIDKFSNKK